MTGLISTLAPAGAHQQRPLDRDRSGGAAGDLVLEAFLDAGRVDVHVLEVRLDAGRFDVHVVLEVVIAEVETADEQRAHVEPPDRRVGFARPAGWQVGDTARRHG